MQQSPHENLAFTGEPNIECMDGHHNGHIQMERIIAEVDDKMNRFTLCWKKMDGFYKIMQTRSRPSNFWMIYCINCNPKKKPL